MRKPPFCGGLGWEASFAFRYPVLLADQKGAPSHPGQGSTCLDLRSLGQSLIASILMQADSLLLVIKTANAAQAIFRMPDQRASLEPQAAGPTLGLTFSPF